MWFFYFLFLFFSKASIFGLRHFTCSVEKTSCCLQYVTEASYHVPKHPRTSISVTICNCFGNWFNCLDVCCTNWAYTAVPLVIVSHACWNILVSLQYFTRISSVHPPISLFNWISSSPSSPLSPHDGTHSLSRQTVWESSRSVSKRTDVNEIPVSSSWRLFSTETPLMSFRGIFYGPWHTSLMSAGG